MIRQKHWNDRFEQNNSSTISTSHLTTYHLVLSPTSLSQFSNMFWYMRCDFHPMRWDEIVRWNEMRWKSISVSQSTMSSVSQSTISWFQICLTSSPTSSSKYFIRRSFVPVVTILRWSHDMVDCETDIIMRWLSMRQIIMIF